MAVQNSAQRQLGGNVFRCRKPPVPLSVLHLTRKCQVHLEKKNRQEFTLTTQARQLLLEITSCISFLWFSPHYERTLICTVSLRVIGKIFFKNSRSPCRFFIHIWNPSRPASFSILKKQTACPGTFYTPPLPCFHCWLFKQETYGKYGQKDFPKLASLVSSLRQPAPSGDSL